MTGWRDIDGSLVMCGSPGMAVAFAVNLQSLHGSILPHDKLKTRPGTLQHMRELAEKDPEWKRYAPRIAAAQVFLKAAADILEGARMSEVKTELAVELTKVEA